MPKLRFKICTRMIQQVFEMCYCKQLSIRWKYPQSSYNLYVSQVNIFFIKWQFKNQSFESTRQLGYTVLGILGIISTYHRIVYCYKLVVSSFHRPILGQTSNRNEFGILMMKMITYTRYTLWSSFFKWDNLFCNYCEIIIVSRRSMLEAFVGIHCPRIYIPTNVYKAFA